MNTTITKEIGIGDAGLPFDVSIEVEYEEKEPHIIIVTDWMENSSPYDNPPESWYYRMMDIIMDYFYEQNNENTVVFCPS